MELEVGMYVRTKKGTIGKINKITKNCVFFDSVMYLGFIKTGIQTKYLYKDKIDTYVSKARYNIIDLIQSKDLIVDTKNNVYVVDRVEGDYVYTTSRNQYGLIITLVDYQIKSILTKEQFESVSYRVNG